MPLAGCGLPPRIDRRKGGAVVVQAASDLAADLDWSGTALGPRAGWPTGLAAVVETLLGAPVPMALAYGRECTLVYNDAYAEILGTKHPAAFGRPAEEVLPENWRQQGHADVVERVFATGEPFYEAETVLPVQRGRRGRSLEQVHFSRAYTAVRADDGSIVGVLTVISEVSRASRALADVARLAGRLSSALTVDDVAREALRHAVLAVGADHARVVLPDGPALRMARQAGWEADDEDRLPPVWVRIPADTRLPSVEVVRSGTPLWLQGRELSAYPGLRNEPVERPGLATAVAVPLHTQSLRGALSLGWQEPREFTPAERSALEAVGRLVGQALARARRFDEQRGLAELLQRSMLPVDLPQVTGLSIGGRYVPSGPDTTAGGDFYDAFPLPDGRIVVAIGDVVGHGVLAAAVMGQVRAALRVLAFETADPVRTLAGLDPLVASLGLECFVTALVGLLDPSSGVLSVASAGHHPPLLRRGTGGCEYVDLAPGPPIGIVGERPAATAALGVGDVAVLFTDGLVEVPGQDLGVGLGALRRVAAEHREIRDPRRLCTLLLGHLGSGGDDIAILAVTRDDGQHRTAATDLPADTLAPATARAWVRAQLRAWGAEHDLVDAALLGVSELVTNAFLHARSGARVELDLDAQRLLVLVTDSGLQHPVRAQEAELTAVRGRGLAVVEAISDAWGSEENARGTSVWFEVARHRAASRPA